MPRNALSLSEARRIALAAQGAHLPRPDKRPTAVHLRRLIHRHGLLQIDYANVLLPAHYQVPFSRLGPYDMTRLDDLVYRKREFIEQWAREASIVPVETWPLLRHRMQEHDRRARALGAFLRRYPGYAERVLEAVRLQGPSTAEDMPQQDGPARRNHWWGWSVAKTALEAHFARGTLAVAYRRPADWARVYDLTERVLPPAAEGTMAKDEAQRELLSRAARAHGVGTVADLADYYRVPVREARPRLAELVTSGKLLSVQVEGWREPAYVHPEAELPKRVEACAILSPFDPLVWHRPRLARLFEFDYVLEIWTPRAKRRWGYYVLPFLLGDRLVARVDLKADRPRRRLLVQAAHREAHARADEVSAALAAELRTLASWLELDTIIVARRGGLARALAACLRH